MAAAAGFICIGDGMKARAMPSNTPLQRPPTPPIEQRNKF